MTPTLLSQLSHRTPLSSVSSAIPRVDSALRLALPPVPNRRAAIDGAWWPYSRDAAAELPDLIAAVDQRLGRTTLRVGVHQDAWQSIPRRIPARGRQVRIGWFRHADPHVITLIFAAGEPVVLLVIPPDTAVGAAQTMLTFTVRDTTGLTAEDILTLPSPSPDPAFGVRTADSPARWENEGGSVIAQEAPPPGDRPSGPA
ncbi:DUF5994 family protein [Planobispora longispora]|uniref:Uncharacterized protein n=1 Tax=Planobispora longispora TaxID=28887 RepID=A0A8J3RPX2_9ACTN|nr:DUF5994 family protein [Planobispora longispora]GIH79050.1 hypothetical protein Plo01_54790 [Planobispora longispora]